MGSGTDIDATGSIEQGEGSPLDEGVTIQLSPADVWVLGQLVEEGGLQLPSSIDEDIQNGYRILRTANYRPPPGTPSPDAESWGDEIKGPLREVVLAEVTSTTPAPTEGQPEAARGGQAARPAGAGIDVEPLASAHDRLAEALETLAAGTSGPVTVRVESEAAQDTAAEADEDAEPGVSAQRRALDTGLAAVATIVATTFVVGSALASDPVFAVLGVGLLVVSGALAYPHLAGGEGSP